MSTTVVHYRCSNPSSVLSKRPGNNAIISGSRPYHNGAPAKFGSADQNSSFEIGRSIYIDISGTLSSGASAGRYGPELINDFKNKPILAVQPRPAFSNPGNPLLRHRREVGKPVSGNKSMITSSDEYIQRKKILR